MKNRRFHAFFVAAICSLSLLAAPRSNAQGEIPDDPGGLQLGELVTFSIQLMQLQQWEKASKFNEQAIKDEGAGALKDWGPLFGTIYYRAGLCHMKLKQYGEAASDFEKCYKDFPNKDGAMNENEFEKRALFQWAKAEMGLEEWQKALDLFQKFLKERESPRDRFSQGDFFISRATCYYKLRQIVPGNQSLESAMQNKLAYRVPDQAILNCFREMVEAALEKENEQAIVDFIRKNRGGILTTDDLMYPYSGVLLKLANDALKSDMKRAAIALYQLLPVTESAIDINKDKIKGMGQMKRLRNPVSGAMLYLEQKEKLQGKLEEQIDSPKSVQIIQLNAMAVMHEREGNTRGAHAAYRMLEDYFSHAEKREDNLYNMARTSFLVDGGSNALADAQKFLELFPASEHASAIKRLMFASLFAEQRYEECIESASEMIDKLPKGSPDHDICLHVLGGSFFYTGQYEKAEPLLQQHVDEYPDSDSKIAAAYFHAANPYRLQDHVTAAKRLDAFLEKFPDPQENIFMPFALLDRATCYYMNEENEPTIEMTSRLIDGYKDHSVLDQAHNLRGNAHLALESNSDAQRDYEIALGLAERWGHDVVAGESLFLLADLMITEGEDARDKERMMQALPFINRYWKEFAESGFKRQMAIRQVPVLVEDGRLDEALEKLSELIVEFGKSENVTGLERVIPNYAEAFLTKYSPDELRDKFLAFPGLDLADKVPRALLYIQVISVYQKVAKKAEKMGDEEAKLDALATVKNLFGELKNAFDLKDLASSILIDVGDYIRTTMEGPAKKEALPFYTEVLEREEAELRLDALLGRGEIYGDSILPNEIDLGLADFRKVHSESEEKKHKERALYNIVRLLMKKKDYVEAATQAKLFLKKENRYGQNRKAKVYLWLGESYEERKMNEDAIAIYARVWATMTGNVAASAPAMERWMRILWNRNQPAKEGVLGDRQGAYEGGRKYIMQTGRFRDKMVASDLEAWLKVDRLVKQYEANPNVKPVREEEED